MSSDVVQVHLQAAREYLEVAARLLKEEEYFAAILLAAVGAERAVVALILHLGATPAPAHRHHLVLQQPELRSRVPEKFSSNYERLIRETAILMGELTTVRYAVWRGGRAVTPRQLYSKKEAQRLFDAAQHVVRTAEKIVSAR